MAHYEKAYGLALNYSDLSVATDAVYAMLAFHPNDLAIKDTLARLYFTRGLSVQALLVGRGHGGRVGRLRLSDNAASAGLGLTPRSTPAVLPEC